MSVACREQRVDLMCCELKSMVGASQFLNVSQCGRKKKKKKKALDVSGYWLDYHRSVCVLKARANR